MGSGPPSDGQVQLHYRDLAELLPNSVVYILDRDLRVVFAGGSLMAQRDFAAANLPASGMAGAVREGANYAAVCRAAAAEGCKEAQQWLDGMRAVLAGEAELVEVEYPCPNASEQHWFVARITRLAQDGPPRLVVAHENIT